MGRRIELDGATALITGSGGGIGRATALALAARGARVLVADIDVAAAEKVVAEIEEQGCSASAHELDVRDPDAVAGLAAVTAPDVLVCNAGVGMTGRSAAMSIEDWQWIRSVNLDGVVHCCLAFGPAMLERGRGQVVILSSGLGYTPRATEAAYCTTKAAVLMLARSLRADWASSGVGVSAVCPGVINTGIIERSRFLDVDVKDQEKVRRLFRRGHTPALVARDIVRAIDGDRAIVAAGWEAKLGWWTSRLAPVAVQQAVARQGAR